MLSDVFFMSYSAPPELYMRRVRSGSYFRVMDVQVFCRSNMGFLILGSDITDKSHFAVIAMKKEATDDRIHLGNAVCQFRIAVSKPV